MGAGGLFYRKTFSGATRQSDLHQSEVSPTSESSGATHGYLASTVTADVQRMIDSTNRELLEEINQKNNKIPIWPIGVMVGVLALIASLGIQLSPIASISIAVLMIIAGVFLYQWDKIRKSVVIMYDLDNTAETAFENLCSAVKRLDVEKAWLMDAMGKVHDPKYHGGAGALVSRKDIQIHRHSPAFIQTNIELTGIHADVVDLYFFPDMILVHSNGSYGAVSYGSASCVSKETQFIEAQEAPYGARIVGYTWRYVNRDGGPDKRFSDNPQLPICIYEEIWLNSPKGLSIVLLSSNPGTGNFLDRVFQEMADEANRKATLQERPLPTDKGHDPNLKHSVLFEVLACLMAADGVVSTDEVKKIKSLMEKSGCPWSESELDEMLKRFVLKLKSTGYRSVMKQVFSDVQVFKENGDTATLFSLLDQMIEADGKIDSREIQFCKRLKATLE